MMRFRRVDINGDGPDDGEPFDLIHINADLFEKIKEWADYHGSLVRPMTMEEEENALRWEEEYFGENREYLCNLMMAANYLEVDLLYRAVQRKLIDQICILAQSKMNELLLAPDSTLQN